MKIINVVGARPNFMKIAPIIKAMNEWPDKIEQKLVHTGQHYDQQMSKAFFEDLEMPKPDINLGIGSGSHAEQTAGIMVAFERICLEEKPDLVVVVGDVNSTLACTLTAKKIGIRVAHVEAGLRSRDMSMPEEINRLCTDVLSDYLFTTDHFANENLIAEGVPSEKIVFVGNVMIDTLLGFLEKAKKLDLIHQLGLDPGSFITMTLHRPSNVDDRAALKGILESLHQIAKEMPIVFPAHPRTRKMIGEFGLSHFFVEGDTVRGIWITEPMGYIEFLHLNMNAGIMITDSGGLQEESTVLGIPCLTLRNNTERPITCEVGTNIVVGNKKENILYHAKKILNGDMKKGSIPEKWDGKAARRIVAHLLGSRGV